MYQLFLRPILAVAFVSIGLLFVSASSHATAEDPQPLKEATGRYITKDKEILAELNRDVMALKTFGRATHRNETSHEVKYTYLEMANQALNQLRNDSYANRNALVDALNQHSTPERRNEFLAFFDRGLQEREQSILAERKLIEAYVPAVCSPQAPRSACPNPYPHQNPAAPSAPAPAPAPSPVATPVAAPAPAQPAVKAPNPAPAPTQPAVKAPSPAPAPAPVKTPAEPAEEAEEAPVPAYVQEAEAAYNKARYQRGYSLAMTIRYLNLGYTYDVLAGMSKAEAFARYAEGKSRIPGSFIPRAYEERNKLIDVYNRAGMFEKRDALIEEVEKEVRGYYQAAEISPEAYARYGR